MSSSFMDSSSQLENSFPWFRSWNTYKSTGTI